RGGEILDAALRHRGDDSPAEAGNIGGDGGGHGNVVVRAQRAGEIEEVAYLHGIGDARQHVGVQSAESDAAGADVGEEFVALGRGGLLQIALQGPGGFHIPFVAGVGGIVSRVADEAHGLFQVVPLFAFDVALQIGVSDVVVRVGEKIKISLVDGRDGNRAGFDDVSIELIDEGDGS